MKKNKENSINRKQITAAVKNSELVPSDGVFDSIMERVDILKYDTEQIQTNDKFSSHTTAGTKIKRKSPLIAAAAMMLLMSFGVGAYYISTLFFAPGYGILQDADFTIYATKDKVVLGDFVVDAVTRTADENESTVCMWLFRAEEIQMADEERISGIPPLELTNITAVFEDGTEIKAQPGLISTVGFSQYMFPDTPDTNTFRLRDNNGNEATVTLEDISKTEYADLKA